MTIAQVIVSDVVSLRERGKYQGILVGYRVTAPLQRRHLRDQPNTMSLPLIHKGRCRSHRERNRTHHRRRPGLKSFLVRSFPTSPRKEVQQAMHGKLISFFTARRRDIFRINLPLSAFCAVCVIFFMPLKKVEGHWKECVARNHDARSTEARQKC